MNRIPTAVALLGLLVRASAGGEVIRLKNRAVDGTSSPGAVAESSASIPHSGHWMVQFSQYPDRNIRRELARRGATIVDYVPDSALMTNFPRVTSLRGLGVVWIGQLTPADKLGAGLEQARTYLVIFHHDISPKQISQTLRDYSTLPAQDLLPGHALITANPDAANRLAARDEVAYIAPGNVELAVRSRGFRCGGPETEAGSIGEYALVGSGWAKDASGHVGIGYYFDSLPENLDAGVVRTQIERAFAEWQRYANIAIQPAQQAAAARSIDVIFGRRAHGDAYPFDGPGGVLAHTFYPAPVNSDPIAGDMHFDDDEKWEVSPFTGPGIDVFSVALHEAGHALGLGHSTVPGAVMYPYYAMSTGLTSDDITAIQAIYGAPGSGGSGSTGSTGSAGSGSSPGSGSGSGSNGSGAGSPDTIPPQITITTPAATIVSTQSASITVTGTASDNVGVSSVKWSTSNGDAGAASGATTWSATIPVYTGTNVITVRAYDAAGNSSWRALTVVRQ